MKISLAWLFDHIDADLRSQNPAALVELLTRKSAEVEGIERVAFKFSRELFAVAEIVCVADVVNVAIPEWNVKSSLPVRSDIFFPDSVCLVVRDGGTIRWATFADCGSNRDGLMVPLSVAQKLRAGGWKKNVEWDDVIFEIDNKSVTHRPDLWGHHGLGRELAALLQLPFKSDRAFLASLPVQEHGDSCKQSADLPWRIKNEATAACSRFTATRFTAVEHKASPIAMAFRLLRVGAKPINALVDLTNYVMFDWGQPVHAYDAASVEGNTVIIRFAKEGEQLVMLDGSTIKLAPEDLLIASSSKPMSLAGVMGGIVHSVTAHTKSLLFESATFDAPTIRRTAQRHVLRTEASARFEKTLSRQQATEAVQRFVALAQQYEVKVVVDGPIHAIGSLPAPVTIDVQHDFLEQRAGVSLIADDVVNPLTRLGFTVKVNNGVYHITVPPFRASKDVGIPEDILEEVVRCYGFERIPQSLPAIRSEPVDPRSRFRLRAIKKYLAHGASMMEQYNYAFIDEAFVRLLETDCAALTDGAVEIINPVSENARRLVISLLPGLLKNVVDGAPNYDQMAFFEVGRVWLPKHGEKRRLAGIVFNKHGDINFYQWKTVVSEMLSICGVRSTTWTSGTNHPLLEATGANVVFDLAAKDKACAVVSPIRADVLHKLGLPTTATALAMEFDLEPLIQYQAPVVRYQPISKFQESWFDLSFMVPISTTVAVLEHEMRGAHELIKSVALVDFFEKEEWLTQRSLAFRVVCGSDERTLTKDEIEAVRLATIKVATKHGAVVRAA